MNTQLKEINEIIALCDRMVDYIEKTVLFVQAIRNTRLIKCK